MLIRARPWPTSVCSCVLRELLAFQNTRMVVRGPVEEGLTLHYVTPRIIGNLCGLSSLRFLRIFLDFFSFRIFFSKKIILDIFLFNS